MDISIGNRVKNLENWKLVAPIVSVLVVFAGIIVFSGPDSTRERVSISDFNQSGLENYNIESSGSKKIAGIPVDEVTLSREDSFFRAEIYHEVDRGFAENYIESRKKEIKSVYTDKPAPYGGIPEKNVDCSSEYTVDIVEEKINLTQLELYADEKRNFGACSDEEASYRVQVNLLYCQKNDKLVETESYLPVNTNISHPLIRCGVR